MSPQYWERSLLSTIALSSRVTRWSLRRPAVERSAALRCHSSRRCTTRRHTSPARSSTTTTTTTGPHLGPPASTALTTASTAAKSSWIPCRVAVPTDRTANRRPASCSRRLHDGTGCRPVFYRVCCSSSRRLIVLKAACTYLAAFRVKFELL